MPFLGKQPLSGEFKKLDAITPDGSTSYTLQHSSIDFKPGQAERLIVSVNGVIQSPASAFTVSGSTITFSEALTSSDVIDFIISMGEVGNAVVPADNSVTTGMLVDGAVTADKIDSGSSIITKSATAPSNPANGDFWYDTDDTAFKFYDGNDWQLIKSSFTATGGTITEAEGYRIHTFTSSGTFEVTKGSAAVEYLVIGGGGAGGGGVSVYEPGAGGGAGGYRCSVSSETSGENSLAESPLTVATGSYSVVVGAGGTGVLYTGAPNPGNNSSFSTIVSAGGGGGGDYNSAPLAGGSGGGGAEQAGASGTAGQGHAGGSGVSAGGGGQTASGGGGGGAGSAGANGSNYTGGNGGSGITSSITGTAVGRAGGGGGGGRDTRGVGSDGGGNAILSGNGQSATVNTGGGGGGSMATSSGNYLGGNGGSGIVIIRYPI